MTMGNFHYTKNSNKELQVVIEKNQVVIEQQRKDFEKYQEKVNKQLEKAAADRKNSELRLERIAKEYQDQNQKHNQIIKELKIENERERENLIRRVQKAIYEPELSGHACLWLSVSADMSAFFF